jgi:hypothetical protein
MTDNSSQLDRLDPTVAPGRDTPAVLGTELPGGCQRCTDLYRRLEAFDDRDANSRDYIRRLVADLAAAERTIRELRARYQGDAR